MTIPKDLDEAFGDRRIKAGGALECRATGVLEKLGPAVDPDACRFLRPCSEAPRDLYGQIVRSTPVDAGPTNTTGTRKSP